MSLQIIENSIRSFKEKHAFGEELADCFPPWYLVRVFGYSDIEAIKHSSDAKSGTRGPGFDKGIDAFHINKTKGSSPVLYIIQSKYSSSPEYVRQGLKDFYKALEWLKMAITSPEADFERENKVLVNLRAELDRLNIEEKTAIKIYFVLIHLSELPLEVLYNKYSSALDDLKEEIRHVFQERQTKIILEGPSEIVKAPLPENCPSMQEKIYFQGESIIIPKSDSTTMYIGLGHLHDLVVLYETRKEDLFSKNVRMFITGKKNVEKGPSGKMRETLGLMCLNDSKIMPEMFSLYHNGVTIYAKDVIRDGAQLLLRDPYVLNGCQTITTAYRFRTTSRKAERIQEDLWRRVTIPIRVIQSRDEELIRIVTVNNNRQNAISASALRANDPIQIELEHRLQEMKIFYERQEGAYEYIENFDPRRLNDNFSASIEGPVYMEDIARVIAAASVEFAIAMNLADLFESDAAYGRCFSDRKTSNTPLLVFLQNIYNVFALVLKNDLGLEWRTSIVKSGRVQFFILCLFFRYICKEKKIDFIERYSTSIVGRDRFLREEVAKYLDNRHSGIKNAIVNKFMSLEDSQMESLNEAMTRSERSLRLTPDYSIFNIF
ncbi:MAG: AIPR family protein [bacterium]|nr:AIPR family protein [bacterium]